MRNIKLIGLSIMILLIGITSLFAGDGTIDIATLPYTISTPGSYVVVKNLSLSAQNTNGITINASNVTIDLAGHTITGPGKTAGASGYGIYASGKTNIKIFNGKITQWKSSGIGLVTQSDNSSIDSVICIDNGGAGISVTANAIITNNQCISNGGYGIYINSYSYIKGNIVYNNDSIGIYVQGVSCVITENVCSYNKNDGINLTNASIVDKNVLIQNSGAGINAYRENTISNNQCNLNNYGIRLYGTGDRQNVVMNNSLVNNTTAGLFVESSKNYIASNRASGNGTEYQVAGGNTAGTGDLANISF